jgi:Xaa-Pro dipeptidase
VPALLKPALEKPTQATFLNESKLNDLYDFGGIRIEDNIIVTEGGYENVTDVPKERDDIEKVMGN